MTLERAISLSLRAQRSNPALEPLDCRAALAMTAFVCLLFPATAFAQRTDDNAVTAAEDAFGKSVGGESIGIYNPDDVRGFSPVAAGNLRVEGLYFDQQSNITSRVIAGSTVHVGLSAQGYPFPAPTGIADYELRKPGKDAVLSPAITYGPFGGVSIEVDALLPLDGERLGLAGGIGFYREQYQNGQTADSETFGFTLRYAPSPNFSIQPFMGGQNIRDEEGNSVYFTAGDYVPPRVKRGPFNGQTWADFAGQVRNYGVVSKGKLAGFDLSLGVFRSLIQIDEDYFDLHRDVDQNGKSASRIVVVERDNRFGSTSGELRVSRLFGEGSRRHIVHASARARAVNRRYGGSVLIDLGPSRIGVQDFRPEPVVTIGAKTKDAVRQKTFGLGYELRWAKRGELSLGLQKTDYTKSVVDAGGGKAGSKDAPWLFSATGAVYLTGKLALYGGYVRGLEESDVAPAVAINRNEAPPAIRTQQHDFGLRLNVTKRVTAVLGYFNVEKPYFNLDAGNRYRSLGTVRNRGLELSLSGKVTPSLTLVTGAILLDSAVSGEEVDRGLMGKRPIGSIKLRTITNINWEVPWHKPLTLSARIDSASGRIANAANSFKVPARQVLNLGARYKLDVGGKPVLVQASVDNLFNTFGWHVGGSGFFTPNGQRRYSLTLAVDL